MSVWTRRMRVAWRRWREQDGGLIAAGLSFHVLFSLFPALLVLGAVTGLLMRFTGWGQNAEARLLEFVAAETSARLAEQIGRLLSGVERNALISGPVGVLTLLLTATALFHHVDRVLSRLWGKPAGGRGAAAILRRILFRRLRAFLMLLIVGLLIFLAFAANLMLSAVQTHWWPELAGGGLWSLCRLAVSAGVNTMLFTTLYAGLLPGSPPRRAVLEAGVLVTVLWELGRLVLSAVLLGRKYGAYGVVGAFMAIQLWTYFACAVLLLGAHYVRAAEETGAGAPAGGAPSRPRRRARRRRENTANPSSLP